MKTIMSISAAALLVTTFPAFAETKAPSEDTAKEHLKAAESIVGASGPLERAGGGSSFSAFQFSSEQGETAVSLALAFNLKSYAPVKKESVDSDDNESSTFYNVSSLKLTVKGEAPVDEKSGLPRFFSGDSFVTGTKVKAALTRFSTTLGDGRGVEEIEDRSLVMCVDAEAKVWKKENPGSESDGLVENFLTSYLIARSTSSPENALAKVTKTFPEISSHIQPLCFAKALRAVVRNYNPSEFAKWDSGYFDQSASWFFGADASVGKDAYEFLDRATFSKAEINRTSWELGGYIGWIGDDLSWSGRGRVIYGKSYKSPDDAQVCRAVVGSPEPECLTGPDGKPARSKDGLFSVEFRKMFMLDETNKVGIAPQFTYRFNEKEFGAELPIYLTRDKNGKLNGGLKLAYDSKGDDVSFGLFIGAPLSIFYD